MADSAVYTPAHLQHANVRRDHDPGARRHDDRRVLERYGLAIGVARIAHRKLLHFAETQCAVRAVLWPAGTLEPIFRAAGTVHRVIVRDLDVVSTHFRRDQQSEAGIVRQTDGRAPWIRQGSVVVRSDHVLRSDTNAAATGTGDRIVAIGAIYRGAAQ